MNVMTTNFAILITSLLIWVSSLFSCLRGTDIGNGYKPKEPNDRTYEEVVNENEKQTSTDTADNDTTGPSSQFPESNSSQTPSLNYQTTMSFLLTSCASPFFFNTAPLYSSSQIALTTINQNDGTTLLSIAASDTVELQPTLSSPYQIDIIEMSMDIDTDGSCSEIYTEENLIIDNHSQVTKQSLQITNTLGTAKVEWYLIPDKEHPSEKLVVKMSVTLNETTQTFSMPPSD